MKVKRAIVVTLTSAWAWALASQFKVLRQSFFCMLWARHCQANYPVRGQVLLLNTSVAAILLRRCIYFYVSAEMYHMLCLLIYIYIYI